MSKDRREPSREELIRKIAGEIDLHYPLVMVASGAILDIALKAVAEIADEVERQQENDHGAANTGGASAVKAAILALTSKGTSQ